MKKKKIYYFRILFPLLSIILFSSCDIFETRDAEKPSESTGTFKQPFTQEDVIDNLINALKDKNTTNYMSCFSDPNFADRAFVFSPSAGAASQFPVYSSQWDRKNEELYFKNLITHVTDNSQITLVFTNSSYNKGDTTIFTSSYTLTIPQDDASIPQNYQGELRFSMIRDSRSTWSIYYWVDIKRDDSPAWSDLKGRFYNL